MARTAASVCVAALAAAGVALAGASALAQQEPAAEPGLPHSVPQPADDAATPPVNRTVTETPLAPGPDRQEELGAEEGGATVDLGTEIRPAELVHVPVTGIYPNMAKPKVSLDIPDLDDEQRIWRGKQWFVQFNCAGCHAPHGGGGMGPSLSNTTFLYGQEPENIYLTILQGRPRGMPVWGGLLPDQIIWDLVAYVRRLAKDDTPWGRTISLEAFEIEQIPSQYIDTIEPWQHTTPFSYGQPPFTEVETPTKEEPDVPTPSE